MKKFVVVILMLLCAQSYAFYVSPQIGTLGGGLQVGHRINDYFQVRGNANYLAFEFEVEDIKSDIDHLSAGILADFHPFEGGFRLTAGGYYSNFKIKGSKHLSSTQTFNIGGQDYSAADIGGVEAEMKYNGIMPYAGLGWDISLGSLVINTDLGAMLVSGLDVTFKTEKDLLFPVPQAELDRRIKKEIEDREDFLKVYPVISIGLGYKF